MTQRNSDRTDYGRACDIMSVIKELKKLFEKKDLNKKTIVSSYLFISKCNWMQITLYTVILSPVIISSVNTCLHYCSVAEAIMHELEIIIIVFSYEHKLNVLFTYV